LRAELPTGTRRQGSRSRFSPFIITVYAAVFILGLIQGADAYAHRPSGTVQHAEGSNAILLHVIVAIVAAVVAVSIQSRRSRRGYQEPSIWKAPFSANAASRLRRTLTFSAGLSALNLIRPLPVLLLLALLLYAPLRMGSQVTSGLDPNATVNAWGGPTYLGALLAHWLDSIIGFYIVAMILGRLLVPADDGSLRESNANARR
jgi:hypothetical protein